jgi:hypothetical protein
MVDEARWGYSIIKHVWQAIRDILSISSDFLKKGFMSLIFIQMTIYKGILKCEPITEDDDSLDLERLNC